MRIDAITIREIQMPLVHPFETSFGRTTARRIILVTAHCGSIDGWGECTAGEHPFFSEESTDTAWHVLRDYLAPMLLGKSFEYAHESVSVIERARANRMAKAALENALWDAEAQHRNVPLWQLIGGTFDEIACGVSIGIQPSLDHLVGKVETEVVAGYQRIKVKVKPGWDIDVLSRLRHHWPNILLSCDANSAYTLDQIDHLRKFDQFRLLMIEQPLWSDDIHSHARLQAELETSLCLDESIRHHRDAAAALDLGACRIINIKLGRVGGFSEAQRVEHLCRSHGVPVWCGGMLESGIGRSHNIAMSTLPGFTLPGDVSASARYWHEDIIEPEVTVSKKGTIAVPQAAGRGFNIKEALVEKLAVRKEVLRA